MERKVYASRGKVWKFQFRVRVGTLWSFEVIANVGPVICVFQMEGVSLS